MGTKGGPYFGSGTQELEVQGALHSGQGAQGPGAQEGPAEGALKGPGAQGPEGLSETKVRKCKYVYLIPLSEINHKICQTMNLKCINAL